MARRVLFFIHLPQDLDLLLPILKEMNAHNGFVSVVWMTDRVYRASPRLRKAISSSGAPWKIVPYLTSRFGFLPSLYGFCALVTAAESTARPHRVAHLLTRKANGAGLRTYTLQQGLENVGLNHSHASYGPQRIHFASQRIFTWGGPDTLDGRVPRQTRLRCVAVGCSKETQAMPHPVRRPDWKHVITVFENLHRSDYSRQFVHDFISDLKRAADSFPETTFLLKPHHNQRWSAIHCKKELRKITNICLADPREPQWEPFTSAGFAAISEGVITTPSTVALDAARAGCPVAVAGYGLSLERYRPLTVLRRSEDWIAFVRCVLGPAGRENELRKAGSFLERVLVSGPAARRIVETLCADIS